MTTEKRRAPKQTVLSIEKTGRWGQYVYSHTLTCGHKDVRKRAATSTEIACIWCLRANEKDKELKQMSSSVPEVFFIDENLAEQETKIEKIRASIASKIGVPMEAIDISTEDVLGVLVIRSAMIYLSAKDVSRIANTR